MEQGNTVTPNPGTEYYPNASMEPSRDNEGWKSLISTLLILIAAPLIAIMLTAFVFQSYEVDGQSMEKTLQNKDRLIVMKTGKTWARITGKTYMPKRGEVVVFNQSNINNEGQRQLIKRVIGLPGDRVVVSEGRITVYNKESPKGFNPDKYLPPEAKVSPVTPGNVDITVPAAEIFVTGDNRTNSQDSRSFGTILTSDVLGI